MDKDLVTWCDDLNSVKGSIGQLQAAFQSVVKKSPSLEEFNKLILFIAKNEQSDDKLVIEKLKLLLNSPQLKIAIKLKQMHYENYTPLLDLLSQINFKSPKSEKFINILLDYRPESHPVDSLQDTEVTDVNRYPAEFPELIKVNDDKLFRRVFMDKSFIDPILEVEKAEDINSVDNRKLIIRGRRLLEFLLVEILDEKYYSIHQDDLTNITEKLMSPTILFKLSLVFNMVSDLKHKLSDKLPFEDKIEVIGNVFLAYLGALAIEYPVSRLKKWVNSVYFKLIQSIYEADKMSHRNYDLLMQKEFDFVLQDPRLEIKFDQLDTDPFVIRLSINGEKMSIGTNMESAEQARVNSIKEFFGNRVLKNKMLEVLYNFDQIRPAAAAKESVEERAGKFQQFIQDNGLALDINTIRINQLHQHVIKLNDVILGSALDPEESGAKTRSEATAYDNLMILIEASKQEAS